MKKVLFTGMTGIHVAANRRRDYVSFTHVLQTMLTKLGYEVYWGTLVDFSHMKLSDFDLVVCGLSQWNSRISAYSYNVLQCTAHKNIIYYVDDWQLRNIEMTDKIYDRLFDNFMLQNNRMPAISVKDKRHLQQMAKFFKGHQLPLIVPTFNWGDPSILLNNMTNPNNFQLFPIDPSPFIDLQLTKNKIKYKKWICASLKDIRNSSFIKGLHLTWPVEFYYNKNYISEQKLFTDVYSKNCGVIAQKYYHAGSGWWRMRFLHAINSSSILIADPSEIGCIGEPFRLTPNFIESMTSSQLQTLAVEQRITFNHKMLSKQDTLTKLEEIIK